jgi:hypothetical protein
LKEIEGREKEKNNVPDYLEKCNIFFTEKNNLMDNMLMFMLMKIYYITQMK